MNHVGTINLESERLILRRYKKEDSNEIFLGFVNQEEFLYYANKEKRTLEEQIKSLENIDEKYLNKEYYNWLIVEKESNKIIGSINLRVDNKNDSVEFNYAIDKRFTSKGYMTEALLVIKRFCFDSLNVNRFQGGAALNNKVSQRVMEKCGLKCEGILRNYLKLRDGYHDMYMYSNIQGE